MIPQESTKNYIVQMSPLNYVTQRRLSPKKRQNNDSSTEDNHVREESVTRPDLPKEEAVVNAKGNSPKK